VTAPTPANTAASAAGELWDRLSDALGAHDVDLDTRGEIQAAYQAAGGETATWDDLPPDIQAKIQEVEQLPRTSWDDPDEVPDDTPDDF
jgi:hypothetical protein